ncbi:uncharacterized protein LOC126555115 [Aphis gossypii]|uniref:uncharacterized protein LOC126555115 n=1 Tax=Aphis gossypii TaxID=80765 RepID=UPI0021596B3E|nr:uncharacterized protein LOC126555115 [Aphis gossypii]
MCERRIYGREKVTILKQFHDSKLGGHLGVNKTIKRIQKQFRWKGMKDDVKKYVKNCTSCQVNTISNRHVKQPMAITSTSSKPFEKIFLDIVGPLPTTLSSNNYILTMQDDLSKYTLGVPIPNHQANTVAEAFVLHFVCVHGIPGTILTDQGTDFLSKTFTEVCKLLKINKVNTSPFRPQTNGGLERSHRTLAEYLRHYVDKNLNNWNHLLPYAFFVYNSTSMQVSHKLAREKLIEHKVKSKDRYDKNENPVNIHVKDLVLLKDNAHKNKLNSLWLGPYEVIEVIGDENIEYNTKYDLLGLKMKNITNICTDKRHIDLCGKYQIEITDLYDEITNQKERLYMSLGGSVNQTDVYQENKRNKRGLINIVGNAMYTLFGVCDDKCAKKTREAIKQTEETGANILHIVKSQTTVVKTAVKKIASSLNQTEALYKEISTKEQKLHERMMQLQNITDDVLDLLLADEVHNLYTIITNQYAYETSTLEQIITAAREGLIHPSLMTPQELASTLKTAERTIKKQYAIPMGTEASELNLHSVSKSLDEIQQMIDEEVIREQSQKHQFIHSNLLYVSNRQVIDIPRRLANYRSQIRNVRRGNFASEIYDEVPFSAPPSPR